MVKSKCGAGHDLAVLDPDTQAQMFSPIKSRMTLALSDGQTWEVEASLMEKEYAISSEGRKGLMKPRNTLNPTHQENTTLVWYQLTSA